MESWSTTAMPDLTGQVAVVTGANSGIGYATAVELARHGARVIAAGRSEERGLAAVSQMREAAPGAEVEWAALDLGDLSSVHTFADRLSTRHEWLDLLVNNAGVVFLTFGRTADGFERQFGINHLGHFALTARLLPLLRSRPGARVVTVASNAHQPVRLDLDDPQGERHFNRAKGYGRSKLANLMFALELHRRVGRAGLDLRSVAVHPGAVGTNLSNGNTPVHKLATRIIARLFRPPSEGAQPSLYAATAADANGGDYIVPGRKGRGPVKQRASSQAYDEADAARLWDISAQLTGLSFEIEPLRQARDMP